MPQVACPRCGAAQDADTSGYACTECGATWAFATCDHCGASFHMRPGTTEWICPDCGAEHGGATMGQLEPDDVAPAGPAATTGETPAAKPTRAPSVAAATNRTSRGPGRGGPPTRGRLLAIAVIGIVVVLAVAFGLSSLGPREAASPAPSSTLSVTQALCLHLRDLQTPREDSLARLAETLQGDADAIETQGDTALAAKVLRLKAAILAYRDALVSQGDLTGVAVKMQRAVAAVPC